MNDWFEWNEVRCTEYGIHVLEQPVLTLPNERATFVDVPGRSGQPHATLREAAAQAAENGSHTPRCGKRQRKPQRMAASRHVAESGSAPRPHR